MHGLYVKKTPLQSRNGSLVNRKNVQISKERKNRASKNRSCCFQRGKCPIRWQQTEIIQNEIENQFECELK